MRQTVMKITMTEEGAEAETAVKRVAVGNAGKVGVKRKRKAKAVVGVMGNAKAKPNDDEEVGVGVLADHPHRPDLEVKALGAVAPPPKRNRKNPRKRPKRKCGREN